MALYKRAKNQPTHQSPASNHGNVIKFWLETSFLFRLLQIIAKQMLWFLKQKQSVVHERKKEKEKEKRNEICSMECHMWHVLGPILDIPPSPCIFLLKVLLAFLEKRSKVLNNVQIHGIPIPIPIHCPSQIEGLPAFISHVIRSVCNQLI